MYCYIPTHCNSNSTHACACLQNTKWTFLIGLNSYTHCQWCFLHHYTLCAPDICSNSVSGVPAPGLFSALYSHCNSKSTHPYLPYTITCISSNMYNLCKRCPCQLKWSMKKVSHRHRQTNETLSQCNLKTQNKDTNQPTSNTKQERKTHQQPPTPTSRALVQCIHA